MMRRLLAALLLLPATAIAQQSSPPREYSGPPGRDFAVNLALKHVTTKMCPRMAQIMPDVSRIETSMMSADADGPTAMYFRANGITNFTQVVLHLKPDPKVLPARLVPGDDPRATFAMTSGTSPGISIGGPLGLWLCDTRANQRGNNAFIVSKELDVILNLRPDP